MSKVVVVVFDAMRPDLMGPEATPNISRFLDAGVRVPNARTVFPSETRVATPTFSTGVLPRSHGLIANAFFDPNLPGGALFNSGKSEGLAVGTGTYGDKLVAAPALGDRLAAAGKAYVTVSTGTPGNALYLSPRARSLGQVAVSVQGRAHCIPEEKLDELERRFGPVPEAAVPNLPRCTWGATVFREHVLAELDPDVAVLWLSEPDISYHHEGIGSPTSRKASLAVDALFAEILTAIRARPDADDFDIVVMSDHGQVATRDQIDVMGEMRAAGFSVADRLDDGTDLVLLSSSSGNVWVRDGDPDMLRRTVEWFQAQRWTGLLFTNGGDGQNGLVPGTFDLALVGNGHSRSPHLYYTMATDDEPNEHGVPGRTFFGADPVPENRGGVHGGLQPRELNNLIGFGGRSFGSGITLRSHAGIVDVAPTILAVAGVSTEGTEGRVIGQAFAGAGADEPARLETVEVSSGAYRQRVTRAIVGGAIYLEEGRRLDGGAA